METILSLLGLLVAIAGYVLSRTDRLLREIRDVLREIRDGLQRDDFFLKENNAMRQRINELNDELAKRLAISPRTIDYPPPYGKKD